MRRARFAVLPGSRQARQECVYGRHRRWCRLREPTMRGDVAELLLGEADLLQQSNWIEALKLYLQPGLGRRIDPIVRQQSLARGRRARDKPCVRGHHRAPWI